MFPKPVEPATETTAEKNVPRYAPRIGKLAIPEARWDDEPLRCLKVNDEWVSHLIGVLNVLDQHDTWEGTDDEVYDARQQVNEIILAFMQECDMNCCCNEIPLSRIDENGHYQQSDDGGVTWHDAPLADPRNNIPRIPPAPPASTDNAKCLYADSVVQHFKTMFVQALENGQTVTEILSLLISAAELIFGTLTGPIGWIIPALVAIPTAIIAFGITDFEAAMTDDVWNKFRCLIYCNNQSDGSITQAGLDAIYAGIDDVSPDNIVRVVLRSWIAALGLTGMNNAAHLGMGEVGADCSGCDCFHDCASEFVIWSSAGLGEHGVIVERGDNYIIADAGDGGNGDWYLLLHTDADDNCCVIPSIEKISGTDWSLVGWAECGEAASEGVPPHVGLFGDDVCVHYIQLQGSDPFRAKLTFAPCP